jgi:CRISPR-associated protein Csm4
MGGDELSLWRIELHLRGPTLSAWQADTIWGHLCWALRHQQGEPALREWLQRYRSGAPPLLVSDAFPGDTLPAPLFPQAAGQPPTDKRIKRARWLTRADFLASAAAGRVILDSEPAEGWRETPTWRNTVSRATGSSISEHAAGGLFALQERWPPGGIVTTYVRVAPRELPLGQELFQTLVHSGFGKRRAVGYGCVTEIIWREETELAQPPSGANGFVSLSSFVPQPTDPIGGAWDLRAKHARFSDEMPGTPWKQPLLLLTTGSSFCARPMRPWYGGVVDNIAVEPSSEPRRNAAQYAYAFPIPARLQGAP